jgi:hypothetical protein
MSPWRRPLTQGCQDRALTTFAACAAGNGSLQFAGYSAQLTPPLLDVDEVMAGQLIDVAAGHRGVVGQRQETANLIQAEAESAAAGDRSPSVHCPQSVRAASA